ncbi:hypothetical protein [Mycobacterium marinum]|uniref:hypothetical protein n=1 Tax=Mycobacterium marinum TaxID=1781 RepID=UPI000E3E4703|nr:hypothetical protein [Mycobacterium marinum]
MGSLARALDTFFTQRGLAMTTTKTSGSPPTGARIGSAAHQPGCTRCHCRRRVHRHAGDRADRGVAVGAFDPAGRTPSLTVIEQVAEHLQ